ncbi:MAG TPA: hypothetical protein VJA18_01350 [Candidatus Nanoarchaeia archaeon]|nr:hypothetical protein [Candidatus Nanoarchaeia archaeon]
MAKSKKMVAVGKKSMKSPRLQASPMPTKKESSINLMVQIHEPKNLRKDILEALREIIIFMQGYEAFRKIQEEKVETFAQLRDDVKSLNSLIDNKLRRYVPKGKLAGMVKKPAMPRKEADPVEKEPMPMREPMRMSKPEPQPAENNELDELETQLRDIESRLKRMN